MEEFHIKMNLFIHVQGKDGETRRQVVRKCMKKAMKEAKKNLRSGPPWPDPDDYEYSDLEAAVYKAESQAKQGLRDMEMHMDE